MADTDPGGASLLAQTLWLALLVAGPPCGAAWAAGALASALGDRVGARDPAVSAFPRIVAAVAALAVAAPWSVEHLVRFGRLAFGRAFGVGQ